MSVDKYHPHVLVLPEDDANSDLANGFWKFPFRFPRRIQVLPCAGGWHKVLETFEADLADDMRKNNNRYIVLLIDFDGKPDRLGTAKQQIPTDLTNRVFILGCLTEPEDLKPAGKGKYEEIGLGLAEDCSKDIEGAWGHKFLRHNAVELERMRDSVRPILFP